MFYVAKAFNDLLKGYEYAYLPTIGYESPQNNIPKELEYPEYLS